MTGAIQNSAGLVKLDAMENPFRLPEHLQRALGERLGRVALNRYPVGCVADEGCGAPVGLRHRADYRAVGGVARVDLGTGAATLLHQGWIPDGLSCVPHQAPDTTLLLCAWEDYRSYGGYVLRTERGEPPVPEQAFSDDGYYIADDGGAVGYVGSCSARPRSVDPDDPRRSGWGEISPAPVVCVRRGPSDWVERSIELGDRRSLLGWAPRRDGTAVALVRGGKEEVLPHPAGEPRVTVEGGVHVVRVYQPAPDWYFTRPARRGVQSFRWRVSL